MVTRAMREKAVWLHQVSSPVSSSTSSLTNLGTSSRSIRPLRKLVYTTVLFVCLTATIYSIRATKQKISSKVNHDSDNTILKRFKREESSFPASTSTNATPTEKPALKETTNVNNTKEKSTEHDTTASSTKKNGGKNASSTVKPGMNSNATKSKEPQQKKVNHDLTNQTNHLKPKSTAKSVLPSSSTTAATHTYSTDSSASTSTSETPKTSSTLQPTSSTITSTLTAAATSSTASEPLSTPKVNKSESSRKPSTAPTPSESSTEIQCEEPAYHQFPDDLFTNEQRARGAIIIHILVGIYMFYALAVVCDEYFVASMEKICQIMGLSEDVAGATFMAAGSSAPELFASILGVFVAEGDVGTGTIVGSAVFNILFVIGFCALCTTQVVVINWWPLLRDSTYYAFTVVALIAVMADGIVTWWESAILLLLYGAYAAIMKYNEKIHIYLVENTRLRIMDEITQQSQGILTCDDKQIRSSYVQFMNDGKKEGDFTSSLSWQGQRDPKELAIDEIIKNYPRKMTLYEAALKVMSSRYFSPKTRFRCACKRIVIERRYLLTEGYPKNMILINECADFNTKPHIRSSGKDSSDDWKMAPSMADRGLVQVVKWFITVPILATLHYTIPDCRNSRWERWYLLTFFVSMLWIAFFSYILVWMVTLVGYTCGVPDTIMGITFLAAGTSVPDAYSSLLVVRQGLGDMAVSNSIGSNVFDILIGLALPWFMRTALIYPGTIVAISSGGMVYNVILLFLSIAATIASIHYARWQLSKQLGIILLVLYAVFLIFSIMIEYNVFGFVNPPECEE